MLFIFVLFLREREKDKGERTSSWVGGEEGKILEALEEGETPSKHTARKSEIKEVEDYFPNQTRHKSMVFCAVLTPKYCGVSLRPYG